MSTDVVVVTQPVAPTLAIRPEDQDLDALDKLIEEEESSRGGMFPGGVYSIKKNNIFEGFGGVNSTRLDERDFSLVLNIPNMWYGWQTFDRSLGKNGRMVYGPLACPLKGQKLADRKTLGKLDKEAWDAPHGRPIDPWQRYAAIPFRFDGETKLNTLLCSSWAQLQNVREFLKAYRADYVKNLGHFPVVNLAAHSEPHWDDPQVRIDTMKLKIVAWDMPIDADFPEVGEAPEQEAIPDDTPKTVTRTENTDAAQDSSNAESGSFGDTVEKLDAEDPVSQRVRRGESTTEPKSESESKDDKDMWPDKQTGRRRRATVDA